MSKGDWTAAQGGDKSPLRVRVDSNGKAVGLIGHDGTAASAREAIAAELGVIGAFPHLPFRIADMGFVWLWKHKVSSGSESGSWWAHVSIGDGYYATFAIGMWATSGPVPHLGRISLGLIGSYKHHTAAGVVKTGAWATSASDLMPAGSCAYSTTAGDRITFSVTGHTLVLRNARITNGGYAVVAIDGDWKAANRLPILTQGDIDAGIGRQEDLGRCWISCYSSNSAADFHTCLAEGLDDLPHTVTIEVTGTKPAAASDPRTFVGGIVGCSAGDVGKTLVADSRVIGTVEKVFDMAHLGASAIDPVLEIEKNALGTWEFVASVHGGETQESLTIMMDGVDVTGLAAGAYAVGRVLVFSRVSTLANTDLPGTPVARRKLRHTFSACRDVPCTITWSYTWLVDKTVRSSYWAMLPFGQLNANANGYVNNGRWDTVTIGSYTSVPDDLTTRNSAAHGKVLSHSASVGISGLSRRAYVAALDNGLGADYFVNSSPDNCFVQDRTDFPKIYCCRSTQASPVSYAAGDVIGGVVGLGLRP